MAAAPFAVVGIGNPGARYARTRHNIGFRAVDALARRLGLAFRKEGASALVAEGGGLVLIKPLTYVNRSGRALLDLLERGDVDRDRLLVIVDDVHLAFGRLRLRASGSSGGHNGLKSIAAALGDEAWPRLRVGVGGPEGADLVEHVLGPFSDEEEQGMQAVLDRVMESVSRVAAGERFENVTATCNRVVDASRRGGGAGVQEE